MRGYDLENLQGRYAVGVLGLSQLGAAFSLLWRFNVVAWGLGLKFSCWRCVILRR
jgi:hypothetical protein